MRTTYLLLVLVAVFGCITAQKHNCYKCESKEGERACIDNFPETFCQSAQCVTKVKDGKISRGCFEDIKCENAGECSMCQEDKCNKDVTTKPKLKCYKCDDCTGELGDDKLAVCTNGFPLDANEKCFTDTTKDGDKTKIARGCFYDLVADKQAECTKKDDCKTCETEKCNKDTETPTESTAPTTPSPITPSPNDDFHCIICRSDKIDQKACASEIKENQFAQKCEIQPTKPEDKACYVQRLENNEVIRDCITTAKALNYAIDKDTCADKDKDGKENRNVKCNFCDSQNCNTMKPRNSGVDLKVYGGLVAFAAVIVTKYF